MRLFSLLICLALFSCASAKEKRFRGSTPAGEVVRNFLNIPLSDSVDFIRWKVTLADDGIFHLNCNYGISKPNTPGFMKGGETVEFSGSYEAKSNHYLLQHNKQSLRLGIINEELIHIADQNQTLLTGTGGWGYTLNNEEKLLSATVNFKAAKDAIPDSIIFQGRTPCPGLDNREECIKKKWLLTLYRGDNDHSGPFRTGTDKYPGLRGTWDMRITPDGRMIYQLNAESGQTFRFQKIADNIIVFTDLQDRLLVGDEHFSYTLSRR